MQVINKVGKDIHSPFTMVSCKACWLDVGRVSSLVHMGKLWAAAAGDDSEQGPRCTLAAPEPAYRVTLRSNLPKAQDAGFKTLLP